VVAACHSSEKAVVLVVYGWSRDTASTTYSPERSSPLGAFLWSVGFGRRPMWRCPQATACSTMFRSSQPSLSLQPSRRLALLQVPSCQPPRWRVSHWCQRPPREWLMQPRSPLGVWWPPQDDQHVFGLRLEAV